MDKKEIFINVKKVLHVCAVCGWTKGEVRELGAICPCCFTEHGYEDIALSNVKKRRKEWIDSGYNWSSPDLKPEHWKPEDQLKNIPEEYR